MEEDKEAFMEHAHRKGERRNNMTGDNRRLLGDFHCSQNRGLAVQEEETNTAGSHHQADFYQRLNSEQPAKKKTVIITTAVSIPSETP